MHRFQDENLDIEDRVKDLINQLTLDEKLTLFPGVRAWWTRKIKRLSFPNMGMSDGPNGVSLHSSGFRKCTQFPVTKCLAATWNTNLAEKTGIAMAEEVRAVNKHILLAPGINIDRTPLNGRTFEYFSEDPFLVKEMTKPFVNGVQSQKIAACVKHYVANNQEHERFKVSAEIDKRTLHEIYLRAFEDVVKKANPWSIMACYNKVNGIYGCENPYILQNVLFDKWGFQGFVMSDWFATRYTSTEGCITAGLSLEMPTPIVYKRKLLKKGLNEGKFTEQRLDELLKMMLRIMFKTGVFSKNPPKGSRNTPEHQNLAQKIAEEGIVLLKNEGILPLDPNKKIKIAVRGRNTKKKMGRLGYGGSSAVVPPFEITPFEGLLSFPNVEIVKDPKEADYVIIFTEINHDKHEDAENSDRLQIEMPTEEENMINETKKLNSNTIVVLINGSPIAMDNWINGIPAIVEAWYPGMMGGNAIANILFGHINPSGKLPITFPKKIRDSPAHKTPATYPGTDKVMYEEGIFVGYRHYDENNIDPLFPFGFGLSYTTFELTKCELSKESLTDDDMLIITVGVKNTGEFSGAEVVQIYATDIESSVERPPKELVGFGKIFLNPNEEKTMEILVKIKDFAFYDVNLEDWKVEPGKFKILIGTSSRSIQFERVVDVQ
ncbi:MAG: glycosyl hydrolase [Promethearchaeota archaeon]|nr:MAG: glycosyl hydrolase [Candidatus Lokiarchaeota archaeon]